MLSGKHVSRNVTPHRLMNGANRAQGKVHSSISGNLCFNIFFTESRGNLLRKEQGGKHILLRGEQTEQKRVKIFKLRQRESEIN